MLPLRQLLLTRTWSDLRAMALAHHRAFNTRYIKAQAAEYIQSWLGQSGYLTRLLSNLAEPAQAALQVLVACEGVIQKERFIKYYGTLQLYRPWRADAQKTPWENPASITTRLWYLGLIYQIKIDVGGQSVITLPLELANILPNHMPPKPEIRTKTNPIISTLTLDLTHFLAYLQHHSVKPLHKRWLSPRHYHSINPSLSFPDATASTARSELQTTYFRFLHFLAESAGFVALSQEYLNPTVAAWEWLDTSELERQCMLYQAWLSMPRLWQRYRQPGTIDLAAAVIDTLSQRDAQLWNLDDLQLAIKAKSIGAGIVDNVADFNTTIDELLQGPFVWSGWGIIDENHQFTLTELGHWLIHATGHPPPMPLTQGLALLAFSGDGIVMQLPDPPKLPPLKAFMEFYLQTDASNCAIRRYTPDGFAQMRREGLSVATIAAKLGALLEDPLPGKVLNCLNRWEASLQTIQLERQILLTVKDPETLSGLLDNRKIRSCLGIRLSPWSVVVKSDASARLVKALHRRGLVLVQDSHGGVPPVNHNTVKESEEQLLTGNTAHLYLALYLTSLIDDIIEVSYKPASDLIYDLASQLDPDTRARLNEIANNTINKLRDSIDGYTAYPAPLPDIDIAATMATIEQAIKQQCPVEIVYHTAGRGERTTRIVEPQWLESGQITSIIPAEIIHLPIVPDPASVPSTTSAGDWIPSCAPLWQTPSGHPQ